MKFFKDIFYMFIKIVTGYYIINGFFSLLLKITHKHKSKKHAYVYIKEFPFFLNESSIYKTRLVLQFFFTILFSSLIAFVLLYNLTPLGMKAHYNSKSDPEIISEILPQNRVKVEIQNGEKITRLNHNLVYFTTKMPFDFNNATVRITYKNADPYQTISLGFQDQEKWHYDTKLFDVPFLNSLSWSHVGKNPVIYQAKPKFSSVQDFILNMPKDAIIGTFDTNYDIGRIGAAYLRDYKPSNTETVIETPLRGRHVMYAYIDKEPFKMKIEKQDLNWYEDPDPFTVSIFKGSELVYQETFQDDGITDKSGKVVPPTDIVVENPGKELPESGVYKIVLDADTDTIITRITTNLHKIVFAGSLFLAANKNAYEKIFSSTIPSTVYTNALVLSAHTFHMSGTQTLVTGDKRIQVNTLKEKKFFTIQDSFSEITVPKNDLVLNGYMGYFAFSPEQFFLPTPYRVIPLSDKEDLDLVDYVVTNYVPSKKMGDWQVAERTFDLHNAYIKDDKLSWVIKVPNLQENKNEVLIKSIEVTFEKQPLL